MGRETVVDRSESQVDTLAVRPESNGALVAHEPTIAAILDRAVAQGMAPETLEKLLAVYERVADRKAAQDFQAAMAAFKEECPPIPRRTENNQFKVTRDGVTAARRYAALEDIEFTIRGPLGKHGLSYRWGETKVENGVLTMACIVAHAGGHRESSAVSLPVDSKAGCSEQQKFGAAMTYAQRYSLIQALGLTTCDEDADGAAVPAPTIDENQTANLKALIEDVKANVPKLLAYFGIERIEDLRASDFHTAVRMLESKRKAQ